MRNLFWILLFVPGCGTLVETSHYGGGTHSVTFTPDGADGLTGTYDIDGAAEGDLGPSWMLLGCDGRVSEQVSKDAAGYTMVLCYEGAVTSNNFCYSEAVITVWLIGDADGSSSPDATVYVQEADLTSRGGGEVSGAVDAVDYGLEGSVSFPLDSVESGCASDTETYAHTVDVTWDFDPDTVLEEKERVSGSWLPYGGS